MRAICLGGQFHQLTIDLSEEQDVFQPTGKLRPRYEKVFHTPDKSEAFFASSDLSLPELSHLVNEYIKSRSPAATAQHAN